MFGRIVNIVRESGRFVGGAHVSSLRSKGSRENVVTSADEENEKFLRSKLTKLVPGFSFVGEKGDDALC